MAAMLTFDIRSVFAATDNGLICVCLCCAYDGILKEGAFRRNQSSMYFEFFGDIKCVDISHLYLLINIMLITFSTTFFSVNLKFLCSCAGLL